MGAVTIRHASNAMINRTLHESLEDCYALSAISRESRTVLNGPGKCAATNPRGFESKCTIEEEQHYV